VRDNYTVDRVLSHIQQLAPHFQSEIDAVYMSYVPPSLASYSSRGLNPRAALLCDGGASYCIRLADAGMPWVDGVNVPEVAVAAEHRYRGANQGAND